MPAGATTEGSIVAYLRLNDSDWNTTLDRAEAKARELATIDPDIRVTADTREALAKLEAVREAENRVGGTTTTVERVSTVKTTTYDSDAALQAAQEQVLAAAYAEADAAIQKLRDDQIAEDEAMRSASVQALKESIMMQALDAAERGAADGAQENARAQAESAAATDTASAAAQGNAGYMGLVVGVVAAAIPLLGSLTGAAFGLAGGLTMMGAAGVLAIFGIKDEMTQATAAGLQYSAGLAVLKDEFALLSDTAASSMLPAFGSALKVVSDAMPWINEEIAQFSALLGTGAVMALEGVLNMLHQANPLFVQAGQYINAIAQGFLSWTQDGGLQQFIAYSETQLPIVMAALGNLVGFVTNVVTAFAPIGTVVLQAVSGLSFVIAHIPVDVLLTVGTFALTAFGAFKLWGAISPIIDKVAISLGGVAIAGDAAMGPIGIIALGVTALVTVFSAVSGAQQKATQAANDYAQALEADNYQIGQQTVQLLAKQLHDTGQLQMAHQLGITTDTYTKAVLGNKDALTQVNATIDAATKKGNTFKDGSLSATDAQKKNAVAADVLKKALDGQIGSVSEGTSIAHAYKDALDAATGATRNSVSETDQLRDAQTKAVTATDNLAKALAGIGQENLSAAQAAVAYQQALADADTAITTNGATLDLNTQKGRDNKTALDNIASSAVATIAAQGKAGVSTTDLTNDMVVARASFIATAEKMGATADQANHLADQYGLVPKNVSTAVSVSGVDAARGQAAALQADLAAVARDYTATVHIVTQGTMPTAGHLAATAGGGPVTQYKAAGGLIDSLFRPQGTDTVPTMLTPDEFVVKRSSAQFNPQFLAAYNRDPASALASVGGKRDRPILMDGALFGILREMANGEARIVVNQASARQHLGITTGRQKAAY